MKSATIPSSHAAGGDLFRRLALALPGAYESSHMDCADFRVNDRIFATLAYVARGLGTLKVTPEQQALFLAEAPHLYEPAAGGWGRMGMTLVRLDAPEDVLAGSLRTAWNTVARKAKVRTRKVSRSSPEA